MNVSILFLTLVGFLAMTCTVSNAEVKGELEYKGAVCKYTEVKKTRGRGPRGITLNCCQGTLKKHCTYYGGNPHVKSCANKYTKDYDGYYKSLAKSAMENGAPCAKKEITEDICGISYPCESGDCPSGTGELKKRPLGSALQTMTFDCPMQYNLLKALFMEGANKLK